MFLVEYVLESKKQKIDCCEGFYDKDYALNFATKLTLCANVDSVMVSEVDTSCADIIFEDKKCQTVEQKKQ